MLSLALPSSGNPAATRSTQGHRVQLHPVVLASILDSHLRRPADHDRVLGTLLGPRSSSLQITEAFSVPYAIRGKGQVTIDVEHHRAMVDLHLKQNPKLVVLGWFATHPELNSFSALIHNFYTAEAPPSIPAVHLALDPESLEFKTYTAQPLLGAGPDGGLAFTPVPHSVLVAPHERPSLDLLSSRLSSLSNLVPSSQQDSSADLSVPTPLEALYSLLNQVTAMLDQVLDYVKQVASGQRDGDDKVARALLETVGSVPHVTAPVEESAERVAAEQEASSRGGAVEGGESTTAAAAAGGPIAAFEEEFNAHLADVLMVSYLANVIKTQAELSSRLNLLV